MQCVQYASYNSLQEGAQQGLRVSQRVRELRRVRETTVRKVNSGGDHPVVGPRLGMAR